MIEDFVINVIWKDEKIVVIDDENLSKKELEKFFIINKNNISENLIFVKKNVGKEIKQNYLYSLIIIIVFTVFINLMESFNFSSNLSVSIGVVITLALGLAFLGLILSPFTTYKKIYFETDNLGEKKIRKQNVFGIITNVLDVDKINEIKLIKDKLNSYFLITEESEGIISENSIILVINSNNINQIAETKNMLKIFLNKEIIVTEIIKEK